MRKVKNMWLEKVCIFFKFLSKVENIQQQALRILYNDCISSYKELLKKSDKSTVNMQNYRTLGIEVLKTINYLNPSFIMLLSKQKNILKMIYNYRLKKLFWSFVSPFWVVAYGEENNEMKLILTTHWSLGGYQNLIS